MRDYVQMAVAVLVLWLAIMFVVALGEQRQLETLKPGLRTTAWSEAVQDCEAHGGVAVPRATAVLGRSADLPACVPQLGD